MDVLKAQLARMQQQLSALSAKCTHAGCTVEWKGKKGQELHCPCHDSVFNGQGMPQSGPAQQPLARFVVQKQGTAFLIKPL